MSRAIMAEFETEAALVEALRAAGERRIKPIDGFAPYLPEGARSAADPGPRRVRLAGALGGIAAAVIGYLVEWWSSVYGYAFNSGGRPLNSWPTFVLAPFEFGVFCAGLCGFIALLVQCGLPRLHDPVFDTADIERATQDRYFLALPAEEGAEALAREAGAVAISEVEL